MNHLLLGKYLWHVFFSVISGFIILTVSDRQLCEALSPSAADLRLYAASTWKKVKRLKTEESFFTQVYIQHDTLNEYICIEPYCVFCVEKMSSLC